MTPLPLAGRYFTTFGALHLLREGDRVEGTYPYQDGRLEGSLRGHRLEGTWTQRGNGAAGAFTFDFDDGANAFRGTWRSEGEAARSGEWSGVRLELPPAEQGGTPGGFHSHAAGPLLAGPLIGEVGERDARIWVQARDTSPIRLVVEGPGEEPPRHVVATPSWKEWLCCVLHVDGLRPGVPYRYRLESAHGATPDRPLPLAPPRGARRVRLAFGSCFHHDREQELPIFDAILRDAPACFVLLGDSTYFEEPDWQSEHTMMLAHLRSRNNDSMRRVVAALPTLGVWDDHDFGPNDSDGDYPGRDAATRAFRRCYAQASWGTPAVPGVFSSVCVGPVEVFLLDSRTHRRASAQRVLGDEQLAWLAEALAASDAPVKLIASPTQVLPETPVRKRWDGFRFNAPWELDALLGEIEARGISGAVFVTGDLHMGNLCHQPGRDLGLGRRGPDLWELTTSPLANHPWNEPAMGQDPYLVREVVDRCNYGLVDVDLDRSGGEILLALKDPAGAVIFEQALDLAALRAR